MNIIRIKSKTDLPDDKVMMEVNSGHFVLATIAARTHYKIEPHIAYRLGRKYYLVLGDLDLHT